MSRTLTAACSLSWLEDGQPRSATIGDTVTVPQWLADDHPHAFRETGGTWTTPPLDFVTDLDQLRTAVAALVKHGAGELESALAEIDAAIVTRDTPPPPVDPDEVPISVTPAELRAAGVTAKVLAKITAT
jgi:hypothetical protein